MASAPPTNGRTLVAWLVVILTVLAVWKVADYRNHPPAISSVAAPLPVTPKPGEGG